MALLEVRNIGISFGGLKAVNDFSLTIEKGQLYGLIGPNGAGKTTVFNLLTGVYKPDTGSIFLDGKNLTGKKTIEINQAGIARTFQNIRLFKDLSVLDNVKAGLHNHHKYSTIEGILRLPRYYRVEKEMNERAMELLKVFDLDGEWDYKASNLPYGKQRKLEIARALATDPKLLLLDEAKICASAGSACSAGAVEPSHVLLALGLTPAQAKSTLRLTLDAANTAEEIDTAAAVITACVQRLRDGVR